jgi:hypothetical protein
LINPSKLRQLAVDAVVFTGVLSVLTIIFIAVIAVYQLVTGP